MKSDFMTNLFFRALQTVGIATMLVRLLLPVAIVAALYLLWRIARNLEKPPKLTEEVKIDVLLWMWDPDISHNTIISDKFRERVLYEL